MVQLCAYACFVALFSAGCAEQEIGDPIALRDAWIREPPPRSPAAGYLVIENRGGDSVELIAAETQVAERTEIHIMEHSNGRMTMRKADGVSVPAGEEIELESGGTHLMLMQLRQPLKVGDEVELQLSFADGTQLKIMAPVRKGGYASH